MFAIHWATYCSTYAHTIVEVEAKTLGDTLDEKEGKTLVFLLADTFAKADPKR